jgi:hypothetical protein
LQTAQGQRFVDDEIARVHATFYFEHITRLRSLYRQLQGVTVFDPPCGRLNLRQNAYECPKKNTVC